jgi:UDP-N-acetylmuramoylalanine--D-glutamate ligase
MLGSFRDRQVAIVGMGRSNQALCRYLVKEGARVTCFDRKTAGELGPVYGEISPLGVRWSLGAGYLDSLLDYAWIFLTPGMKKNLPEIQRARARGAVISNEIALFLERCKARVAGVTGSAGKTTTCTLAGMMLEESLPGTPVYVGGNIGAVLIEEVDAIPQGALVVLELSSFQLELLRKSPDAGLILNIRPNHLDIHDSYQEYVEAKKSIFRFQTAKDWCVLNLDDPVTRGMEPECPGRVGYFTLDPEAARKTLAEGHPVAWLDGEDLFIKGTARSRQVVGGREVRIGARSDFLVPGLHNVSNALGAAMLATILGATPTGIAKAIRAFRGVEHRIEFVRELGSVRYYNDSIATSPDRTEALLEAVPGPLVLIMGGYDKGLPFDQLGEKLVARNCTVVTLGKTAPKIEEALLSAWLRTQSEAALGSAARTDVTRAKSLEEAVRLAASKAKPGSSVVLSPACASFDMFANFEERGARFKEIVRSLT